MVAAATHCPDVLPGEHGIGQTNDCVSGHAGWGMVPAERLAKESWNRGLKYLQDKCVATYLKTYITIKVSYICIVIGF